MVNSTKNGIAILRQKLPAEENKRLREQLLNSSLIKDSSYIDK